jgi:hypothetical protein
LADVVLLMWLIAVLAAEVSTMIRPSVALAAADADVVPPRTPVPVPPRATGSLASVLDLFTRPPSMPSI